MQNFKIWLKIWIFLKTQKNSTQKVKISVSLTLWVYFHLMVVGLFWILTLKYSLHWGLWIFLSYLPKTLRHKTEENAKNLHFWNIYILAWSSSNLLSRPMPISELLDDAADIMWSQQKQVNSRRVFYTQNLYCKLMFGLVEKWKQFQ